MIKSFWISIFFIFTITFLKAQEISSEKKGYKFNNNFNADFSGNSNQQAGALSWAHFHSVNKKQTFKIGYGVRLTMQTGKGLYYQTAPAILLSKQTGPQVLFKKSFPENIDSLYVGSAQNNALNLTLNFQYTIKNKFDVGFNIDVVGFSFGKKITGNYISYQDTTNAKLQTAKPTSMNLLLVDKNDIGTLNSEFYFRYWFLPKWAIKIGAAHLFTEYTTGNKLRLNNDRWRNIATIGMLGVSFSGFR